ncbi:ABC transporter permease subunit/CPBP intramembrane protease [Novipirellula artificiosorum]|uniref:ABC-2 family transporter protein n=1 Tax=Novipirellula artificiosorum TaxID=2528016 RepID=A0A5C6DW39_9BACT|nr:ABC transporter permease subunit/CPBP intramembrane protease [Novipirellula artificiosorum]TWU40878.1 ABC-2 family transporter protein [Novipirellula artificiosorum]
MSNPLYDPPQTAKQKRRAAKLAGRPRLSAIWLIYAREMRDQLRDRRTLFTIAVLPILLYPIVGTLLLQIAQFTQQHPTSVCVVGTEHLPDVPSLVSEDAFAADLAPDAQQLRVVTYRWKDVITDHTVAERASDWVRNGLFDCVVMVPPAFAEPKHRLSDQDASIRLLYNVASDQSMVARDRVTGVLNTWRGGWIRDRLASSGVDLDAIEPFRLSDVDIAPERTREAALWSKLLPFIMLVWAMTGAFYPAIDLVAGEKERGTLETLLCSPALRSEIVMGKLATVTTFSMMTAILNASSMLVTSSFVFRQIGIGSVDNTIGAPPMAPMLWLLVALVPLSALFSALALAVAAMARSSKEGQYYLMPLMMVTLPLVMLPMLPGTSLTAGTSLIPVTGMFLLVRALVEGQYVLALWHLPIVAVVTGVCLWMAAKWAHKQFEDESVLFGGNDQWELRHWVRHLWRDRQTAATPGQAIACGAIILVALFFGKLAVTEMPTTFSGIAQLVLMPQIGMILAPTLLMATVLTTSLRKSLRIRMPYWPTLPLAVLLGASLHPLYVTLASWINQMYPVSEQAAAAMKPFAEQITTAPWLSVVFLMALVPAVCEELAFRGFIFGGLQRGKNAVRAVVVTAILFGISHGVLQQSIAATVMGLLLGFIALRTGSVLPGILLHLTNNALSVSMGRIANSQWGGASMMFHTTAEGPQYQPLWLVACVAIAGICLWWFITLNTHPADAEADHIELDNTIVDPATRLMAST